MKDILVSLLLNAKTKCFKKNTKIYTMKKLLSLSFLVIAGVMLFTLSAQSSYFVVEPGTTLTEESGTTIYIDGDANSTLLLKDDYTYSPSFLQRGNVAFGASVEDSVRVQQYLTKDEWHMISSAVTHEVNGAYMWMYLYEYDEVNGEWVYWNLPTNLHLPQGQGFLLWNPSAHTGGTPHNDDWPVPGDLAEHVGMTINSDVSMSLSYTGGQGDGWNLVGNPFACALDWNNHANWGLTNVTPTAYFYDGANTQYATWNASTGLGTNGKANGYIPSTQGFLVKATSTGASLTLPQAQRLHAESEAFLKDGSNLNYLRAIVSSDFGYDESIIGFDKATAEGIDENFDAYYFPGNGTAPSLYTVDGIEYLAHNFHNQIEGNEVVPLNFEAKENGSYSFSFENIESFDLDVPIWLEDKKSESFTDIRDNNDYTFTGNLNDDYNRFNVHFANPEIPEEEEIASSIYSYEKKIYVVVSEELENSDITVYNLLGERITQKLAKKGMNIIEVSSNNQYYIVKLVGSQEIVTEKVFIH